MVVARNDRLGLRFKYGENVNVNAIVKDRFAGNVAYITPRGNFVMNGAGRVVVSQLHR